MENTTLSHHGIKGQKWGFRRFQNKDGTLTPAGKKRYAQEMERLKKEEKILKNKQRTKAQLDKLDAKRKEIEEQKKAVNGKKPLEDKLKEAVPKKKSIKDMSDEELNAAVNRLRLEKSYKELLKEQNSKAEQASTSKGKAFAKAVWKDAVRPGLTGATTEVIKKVINSAADEAIKKKKAAK